MKKQDKKNRAPSPADRLDRLAGSSPPKKRQPVVPAGAQKRKSAKPRPAPVFDDTPGRDRAREKSMSLEREKRKREAAQRRQQKRKKKLVFRFALLFVFVLVVGLTMCITVFFNIEKLQFKGSITAYTAEEVVAASGVEVGENLFRLNTDKIAETLYRRFPLLDDIQVKRVLPSTLQISAKDAAATMAVQTESGYILLSASGRIIQIAAPQAPDGVHVVAGVKVAGVEVGAKLSFDNDEKYQLLQKLQQSIKKYQLEDVRLIDLSDTANITIQVGEFYKVKLGSDYQLDYKVQMVKEVLAQKNLALQRTILDASIPGKVTAKADTTPVEEAPAPEQPAEDSGDGGDSGDQQPAADAGEQLSTGGEPAADGSADTAAQTPAEQPGGE
ncbi:cell division protein FtsQ/DivIB [Neobittarella massiliensis]|uniref:cell division protein FtsQ/DivIB n=1 Tax=Neobittarella massiliensis (ex Bilen et al. 2018) TaxID=2041842 RepID=UPI000CF6070F|nr:FtsQ-type POTRA domain-containing protein [Neobittarella massiliensis]